MTERRRTSTSNFGVGRREAHDATAFYARFEALELSADSDVLPAVPLKEPFVCGDARAMTEVPDGSVALVVTSPPYFAGKQYEEELGRDGVPASYLEYLQLLRDVFAECKRKLEPGGRIAVNVANLGRKPYRSLSGDVLGILQDDLHLLPRGEVIWQKAEGASGSCAWGSFRSAANPVLRDLTERVVIVSKGRFDRARSQKDRRLQGLPHQSSLTNDEFLAATLDVWTIPPESARRVQHPAPFPVALPERLIHLLTYRGDLVLDPFMGSGSTLVAAARTDRRYAGYDLDPDYVALARRRVDEELGGPWSRRTILPPDGAEDFQSLASQKGKAVQAIAEGVVEEAGFVIVGRNARLRGLGLTHQHHRGGQGRDRLVLRRFRGVHHHPWRIAPNRDGVEVPRPGPCARQAGQGASRPAHLPSSEASERQRQRPSGRRTDAPSSTPSRCCRPAAGGAWRSTPAAAPTSAPSLASGPPRTSPPGVDAFGPTGTGRVARR